MYDQLNKAIDRKYNLMTKYLKTEVIKTNFGEITVGCVNDPAWNVNINMIDPDFKTVFNAEAVLNAVLNKGYHCFVSIRVFYKKEFLDKCVLLGVKPVVRIRKLSGHLDCVWLDDYSIYYKHCSVELLKGDID